MEVGKVIVWAKGHYQSCSVNRHKVFPERYATPGRCDCNYPRLGRKP